MVQLSGRCGTCRKYPERLVLEKVPQVWGLEGSESEWGATYRTKFERSMRFELDLDAGQKGKFEKQIQRGWTNGGPDFGDQFA